MNPEPEDVELPPGSWTGGEHHKQGLHVYTPADCCTPAALLADSEGKGVAEASLESRCLTCHICVRLFPTV